MGENELRAAVTISIFTLLQKVEIFDSTSFISREMVELDKLPEYLANLNAQKGFKFIRIFGDRNYCQGLKEEITRIYNLSGDYEQKPQLTIKLQGE